MILTSQEIEVRREVLAVADELKSLLYRLRGVQAALPEEDVMRAVLGCVLTDSIEPAIRDLEATGGAKGGAEDT
jgi:hypothetical protein